MVESTTAGGFERHQAPTSANIGTGEDARNSTPPRQKRGSKLATLPQVERALAKTFRGIQTGAIKPAQGNAMVNALRTLQESMAAREIADVREALQRVRGGSK